MEEQQKEEEEELVTRVLSMCNETLHPGRLTAGKMLGCWEAADGGEWLPG